MKPEKIRKDVTQRIIRRRLGIKEPADAQEPKKSWEQRFAEAFDNEERARVWTAYIAAAENDPEEYRNRRKQWANDPEASTEEKERRESFLR